MPWSFIIPAAASLIGGSMQANAAKSAANAANAQSRYALDKQIELQEPFRQAGITGQNRLMELLGLGGNTGAEGYGKYARDFSMSDFTLDPGYQFRMDQGTKALERSAASRGGLISGNTGGALQKYGQDLGSQEYQNAFNRYQINRTNQLAPLQSLFGAGQTAANTLGTNYGTYGSETGGNTGNALMARGNAFGSTLSGIGSAYGRNPVSFSSLYDGGGGGGSIGYGSGYAGEGPTGYAP
jgi:hypothetical protein